MSSLKDQIIHIIQTHLDFYGPFKDEELADKILQTIKKEETK